MGVEDGEQAQRAFPGDVGAEISKGIPGAIRTSECSGKGWWRGKSRA